MSSTAGAGTDLVTRVEATLALVDRWGYVPTVETLAEGLLGGRVLPSEILDAVHRSPRVRADAGYVYLRGDEALVAKSRRRGEAHRAQNGRVRRLAQAYAWEVMRSCPFVECAALAGSVASGGYEPGDDIDFDLFVRDGAKYTAYLAATLVGLRYARRGAAAAPSHRTPILQKTMCINVVWHGGETRPFRRQDEGVAFELLRCEPLYGPARFREVLRDNPWIREYFPQLYDRPVGADPPPPPNALGEVLLGIGRHPRLLRALERTSRFVSWLLYRFVQHSRRDPEAVARMEFLRRVKYPYEVFQDSP